MRSDKFIITGNGSAIRPLAVAVGLLMLASQAQAKFYESDAPAAHGDGVMTKLMLDRLEWQDADPDALTVWEAQAWIGGDIDKLWLKSEGSVANGRTEEANLEAYYSHAVAPFWDLQIGARHDFALQGEPAREWLGVGFSGLAPYRFDVDATLYAGENGRFAARAKVGYELQLTQRMVLEPELEANFFSKDDPQRGIGSGLASLDLGLRLHYELSREFSPYVGVLWTNLYGETAALARADGASAHDTLLVAGLSLWW